MIIWFTEMERRLKAGERCVLQRIVTDDDTAARYGSGNLHVLATPALVAFMENTALTLVSPFLSDSESTVGTEISIKHVKATPAGKTIRCTATLEEISGNRLQFRVEAHEGKELIGFGEHTRYIIDVERFMGKLAD
jgi:fluoroacetyl-CoA thioesterase